MILAVHVQIPFFATMTVSESILTFLLLFVYLKFLRNTWLNKMPIVCAEITTVFIGGIDYSVVRAVNLYGNIYGDTGREPLLYF